MADEDRHGPSLELPSFGFGRRRGKKGRSADPAPADPDVATPEPATQPDPREPEATPTDADDRGDSEAPARAEDPDATPVSAPPLFVDEMAARRSEQTEPGAEPGVRQEKAKRQLALPRIGGFPSAIITGALVGVLTVGLTWAGLRLCEVTQGTSSCGTPGFLLLVAILIAMVLLGSALLKAWDVPDPGSTSFLAVGLLAVLALLFLVDVLYSSWMILVIPVLSVLTFVLSHWVTTAFVEPEDY